MGRLPLFFVISAVAVAFLFWQMNRHA